MTGLEWIKGLLMKETLKKTLNELEKYLSSKLRKNYPDFKYSMKRIMPEINKLSKKIKNKNFYPDFILGISGDSLIGGCVIGALLASSRYLSNPKNFRQIFREKPLNQHIEDEFSRKKDILLVDDESRTGKTIDKILGILRETFPDLNIKVAVVIVRSKSWYKLGEQFWEEQFFCYKDIPMDIDVRWPWQV